MYSPRRTSFGKRMYWINGTAPFNSKVLLNVPPLILPPFSSRFIDFIIIFHQLPVYLLSFAYSPASGSWKRTFVYMTTRNTAHIDASPLAIEGTVDSHPSSQPPPLSLSACLLPVPLSCRLLQRCTVQSMVCIQCRSKYLGGKRHHR